MSFKTGEELMKTKQGEISIFRQGDLIFSKIDEVVKGKSQKQLIVAHGENGHFHTLIAELGTEIIGDETKFTLTGKAKLTHGEHDTINFNKGTYLVMKEREFNYINETMEKVRD